MKMTLCHWAGCNRIAKGYYCDVHKTSAAVERARRQTLFKDTTRRQSAQYNALYHTNRWRAMRAAFLAMNSTCVMCGGRATVADHIEPHRGDEAKFFDVNNLQPLCASCHSKKTMQENNYFHR